MDVASHTVMIDFGDGNDPESVPKNDVQRIYVGTSLETDDVVQAKPPGSDCFCLGKVVSCNMDGTYDIEYEGTEELDSCVDDKYIRKVGSGRSSLVKKFKKAVRSISAAKAFGGGREWKPELEERGGANLEESKSDSGREGRDA